MTIRKNSQQLTDIEKARFINVLSQLISAPGDPNLYGSLVAVHREHMKYLMHPNMGDLGIQRFLPWHRVFLLKVEALGQAIDPTFSLPYWDWRIDRNIPDWLINFKPTIRVPGDDVVVTRNPPRPGLSLPTSEAIENVMKAEDFTSFTLSIDMPHGIVHNWMNGTLSDFNNSPNDPIFWLHHSTIDKLWSEWQISNPDQNPTLTGKWKTMTPWTETVTDILDITKLGYRYV
jgi:tyrosinase